MATGLMYECEQKKEYLVNGKIERRWALVSAELIQGVARELIRCRHCWGGVRLHKQKVEHGPADHVEHLSRDDSTHCMGGHYFPVGGTHRMSTNPNL